MNSINKKEMGKYLVAGMLALLTDSVVYFVAFHFVSYSIAKSISFICGTCTAYFVNKYWTFEKKEKSVREAVRFATLYGTSFFVNVGINKLSLTLFPGFVLFAFLAATGSSTVLNFIGQKWWVFKRV
jgi:putative flippase GtrA